MIIDSYDINSEPIVKLENFYGEKQHLVKKCMVIFSKVIYEYMLEKFPCRQIAEVRACNGNIPVWTLPYEEETIAFYLTPIGSALAAGTIAEVNHLTGASVFIMFGSCGSLDKEATDGKFILPTEAYRGEGLSYYFAEPQDYIKIKNTDKLAEFFKERKLPYVQGRVWTTLCMVSSLVFAVYLIVSKKLLEEVGVVTMMKYIFGGAAVTGLIVSSIIGWDAPLLTDALHGEWHWVPWAVKKLYQGVTV